MTELGELGLSTYEEKVYRTLLVTGAATAATVSDASGVPNGRVYDVLNGLRSRRLVRAQSTQPTRYAAVDPGAAVERLLAERAAELREEWTRYRDVADAVRSNLLPTPPADGSVWLGRLGGDEMRTAMHEHVRAATESVSAAVGPPYERASWETLRTEFDAFFEGARDDLDVSLLLSDPVLDSLPDEFRGLVASKPQTVRIRVLPHLPVSFDVVDGTVASVDIPHPQSAADRLGVVVVTDAGVVDEFDRQFRALWGDAVPLFE
ncbi:MULTISPECIES: TrmB family transcriptional regulator [Haloferax]|uniref:TrmB family sugar-specific transcriptional regulator n=3 Tax=Haloferax volcanii TaxID=2246 RepID=M0I1J5_HALVO|nr:MULTISPECIES: helix-turn-helix domain-containing protein [Haloferax]ELK49886.1 TrmB family sugar-specific transcriptional regulator [Haloferax sp. BAB-2207]ELZ70164.1 TrmB family sugar-specific transcriptional regulator [Haloferax lucentense DSM 14919]ELZ90685.1 TrmB family sugar-specific transcriptional regulator [Haloferax alexandrinus JCM 10717]MBC9984999.1 TrmB family transcriptional regulator [Haloferax sp. AS1]QIB76843.1 TrmB family transcriptional regulator [Haloferax alexandrinus]